MHLCRSSSNVPRLPSFLEMLQNPHVLLTFEKAPATRKHIWTSKSAPYPSVFCTFDFEICFAPQRRALFWHRNFQKWSENGVFCTFSLRNVLRATTARTFSPKSLEKHSVSRLSYLFSHLHLLSSYSFSSTLLSSNLSLLSASSLLCFSSVHIVGSLTSKLPSTMPRLSRICRALMAISSTSSLKNAGPQLISCHPNRHTNGEYVFAIGIFLDWHLFKPCQRLGHRHARPNPAKPIFASSNMKSMARWSRANASAPGFVIIVLDLIDILPGQCIVPELDAQSARLGTTKWIQWNRQTEEIRSNLFKLKP